MKNKLKNTNFYSSWKLIKKNPKKIWIIFSIDTVFLCLLFLFDLIILKRMPSPYNLVSTLKPMMVILFYMILQLLIYSLAKYFIFLVLQSTHKKSVFERKDYLKFVLLNGALVLIIFLVLGIFGGIISLIFKPESMQQISLVLSPFVFLVLYIYCNTTQLFFTESKHIKSSLAKSFFVFFKNIRIYLPIIINILFVFVVYNIIFLIFGQIISKYWYTDISINLYNIARIIFLSVFLYMLLLFNRVHLFTILKEKVK